MGGKTYIFQSRTGGGGLYLQKMRVDPKILEKKRNALYNTHVSYEYILEGICPLTGIIRQTSIQEEHKSFIVTQVNTSI